MVKVKELREMLSADNVTIFYNNEPQIFFRDMTSECNDYFSAEDVKISMWDINGEYEIEQMYDEYETIVIEVKGGV